MQLKELVFREASFYRAREKELAEKLEQYPEGTFHCYPNGTAYSKWITYKNQGRIYIPKKQAGLARRMAEKSVLEAELKDCSAELAACDSYLNNLEDQPATALSECMENPGIRKLLSIREKEGEKEACDPIQAWMDDSYEKNPFYPEYLTVSTVTGEKVRSKSESMCVLLLHSMNIPFRYEQKLTLGGNDYYPDFTVLRPRDQKIFLIELFGMMDEPEYVHHTINKLHQYAANGYIPDQNLLCFYESAENPMDIMFMKTVLEYYLGEGSSR